MQKGNQYIIKFALSSFANQNINYDDGDSNYTVAFDLFTFGDDDVIAKLKEGHFYHIKSCVFNGSVNNKITLPSGSKFSQTPYISTEGEFAKVYGLNLGGLYITDMELQ